MDDYLELAAEEGYDETRLQDVSEALDYAAFWLRYNSGDQLIQDLLQIDNGDDERHRELVSFFADRGREEVDEQLEAAMPHVEHEDLDNGRTSTGSTSRTTPTALPTPRRVRRPARSTTARSRRPATP